jgi:hypothetical protein
MVMDKVFTKDCYLEIYSKKKKIYIDLYLNDNYCGEPLKKFIFNKKDSITLNGLKTEVLVKDYENSYS